MLGTQLERTGIERDADEDTIKGAYRRMAKQFHPDGESLFLLFFSAVILDVANGRYDYVEQGLVQFF